MDNIIRTFSKKGFLSGAQASCLQRLREQSKKFSRNPTIMFALSRSGAGIVPALPVKNVF
jgi:hypothetical protein